MDTIDSITAQVETDFELEVRDELASFEVLTSNMRSQDPAACMVSFQEGLNKLVALRSSVDKPLFELLLRRLESYLIDLTEPPDDQVNDIETFLDLMHGILDGEVGGEVNEAEFFVPCPSNARRT
jgi:hypothetical protein